MYKIIDFHSESQKMKFILEEISISRHRELGIYDLQEIHLELLKILNISDLDSELFDDISKTLFVVTHYYQIKNNTKVLLDSLHICKLSNMNNPYIKDKLNNCLTIVGNFEIDKTLINIVSTICLLANRYLEKQEIELDYKVFMNFIRTTLDFSDFKNTSFYVAINIYLEEYKDESDGYLQDLFFNLEVLLTDNIAMINYREFMKWYFKKEKF